MIIPIPRFFSPLTQLHGWWHIGTAISANFQTNFVAFHRRQVSKFNVSILHIHFEKRNMSIVNDKSC